MNRLSDLVVFLEKSHPEAGSGEKERGVKSAWTASDDRYVEHVSLCPQAALAAAGGFIIRA